MPSRTLCVLGAERPIAHSTQSVERGKSVVSRRLSVVYAIGDPVDLVLHFCYCGCIRMINI